VSTRTYRLVLGGIAFAVLLWVTGNTLQVINDNAPTKSETDESASTDTSESSVEVVDGKVKFKGAVKAPPPKASAVTPAATETTPVTSSTVPASTAVSSRAVATRPPIVQRPIPFGAKRQQEMTAYAQRHYGIDTYKLVAPKVIVEHYTVTSTFAAAYNTFVADVADSELHELPGTCAHFIVDKNGTIYQLVPLSIMCRHTVGLNFTAIGIEQVGMTAQEILSRPRQVKAIVALSAWLRCRQHIAMSDVIGHAESLGSPYHHENVARLTTQTHGDWTHAEMPALRSRIRKLACA
jgi:beta-N-acetylhexosaminidase